MRNIIQVVLLCLVACNCSAHRQFNVNRIVPEDGLPQNQVSKVYQDRDGYIWFCTYSGLTKFNGYRFETFDSTDGLPDNTVTSMIQVADGRFLIGTFGEGVVIFDGKRFTPMTTVPEEIAFVGKLVLDQDGIVWIVGAEGVYTWDGINFQQVDLGAIGDTFYYDAAVNSHGSVYISHRSGIAYKKDGAFVSIPLMNSENEPLYVYSIVFSDNDLLYAGTEYGLYKVSELETNPTIEHVPHSQNSSIIFDVLISEGHLWLSTSDGIFTNANDKFEKIVTPDSSIPDIIHRGFEDHHGTLWFATGYGVAIVTETHAHRLTTVDGLPDNEVTDVMEAADGSFYIATRSGIAVFILYEYDRSITSEDGLLSNDIFSLSQHENGIIYVVSYLGLNSILGSNIQSIELDHYPTLVYCDSMGRVWIPSLTEVYQLVDGKAVSMPEETILSKIGTTTISEAPDGSLWFGTLKTGIVILDSNGTRILDAESGLTNQEIWSIAFDAKGSAWVGTNGDGLFHVDGDTIKRYSTENLLQNNFVWQVVCAEGDRVWINTNAGMQLLQNGTSANFDTRHGLVANEGISDSIMLDRNNYVWSGTPFGLNVMDHDQVLAIQPDMPLHIESVLVNDKKIDDLNGVHLDSDQNRIRFTYAALDFTNTTNLQYQYKLSGLDTDWSSSTEDTEVLFAGLAPGDYTFSVRATSNQGVNWKEVSSPISFSIKQPFYRSWYFILGMVTLIAATLYTLYRWRTSLIKIRNEELEVLVQERTASLNKTMEELSRSNIALTRTNADLSAFNAAVSHDLKSPVVRIYSYTELLRESIATDSEDIGSFLDRIEKNCRWSLKLINQLFDLYMSTNQPVSRKTINLSMLAKESAMTCLDNYEGANVALDIKRDIAIESDADLMRVVLLNLFDNAIKYSQKANNPQVRLYQETIDGKHVIVIKDNGIGFPEESAEEIFEIFNRQESGSGVSGFGIGLATARRIITRLGGRIWARSTPGEGSTFYISLTENAEDDE